MQPFIASSRQELLDRFDKNVAEVRPMIERATDDDWMKTWTLKFGGQEIMSMPRAAVMRSVVMNHLIHHRAQLGVYLRLNESKSRACTAPQRTNRSSGSSRKHNQSLLQMVLEWLVGRMARPTFLT